MGSWGCALYLAATTAMAAEPLEVPSGQPISVFEVLLEEQVSGEAWLRARFLAPEIGRGFDFERVADDFMFLCENYALPLALKEAKPASQIVISLSDREVEFGVADPEATQFFEAYRIENGACIWEGF